MPDSIPTPPSPTPTPTPPPAAPAPPPPAVPTPPPGPAPMTPVVPPVPTQASTPGASDISTPKRKSRLPIIIFFIVGILTIVALAAVSGVFTRLVPGGKTVNLTYWGLWEPEEVMRPILDQYQESHPGVIVDYKLQSPQEYRERLQSAISQGKGPDIFRYHNTWLPMLKDDLSPVPSSVYSTSDYEQTFYNVAKSDLKYGGSYLGVPLEIDGLLMYTNDDILSRHNLTAPSNWDELRIAALTMSECASRDGTCGAGSNIIVSGVALGAPENVDHWQDIVASLMLQNGVNLAVPTQPDSKPLTDVIEFFRSFVKTYHVWDSNLPNSTSQFASGKVGIYFGPSWRVFDLQQLNPDLKFSVHPIPQLPVDYARGETPIAYASYWVEAVNKRSPNSSDAWELVKYLSSPEVLQQIYSNSSTSRGFGEPYPRQDMADQLRDKPYVSSVIAQAPIFKSWYLASFTYDGESGLNSKLSTLFADIFSQKVATNSLDADVNEILSAYGISVRSPASQ